jgi:hypothetical protein
LQQNHLRTTVQLKLTLEDLNEDFFFETWPIQGWNTEKHLGDAGALEPPIVRFILIFG